MPTHEAPPPAPLPRDGGEWTGRVGDTWAREWRRTDRSFGALTARLLDPAALAPARHILDIGCGAGELLATLAARDPGLTLTGVDISRQLVATARERCARFVNVQVYVADAARWTPEGPPPDQILSRHGVMFFADPVAAFAHLRGIAAPGAGLRFSCFRARIENAWAMALADALPAPATPSDPYAPGPFAFADPDRVMAILAAAGWRDIALDAFAYDMIAGEGADPVSDTADYFTRIGPAARALAELPPADRERAEARLRTIVAGFAKGGQVTLPAAAWIVTAQSG